MWPNRLAAVGLGPALGWRIVVRVSVTHQARFLAGARCFTDEAAGRFGIAANNWLYYGKAGGGWVGNNATVTNLASGASATSSNTNSGWVLGAGVEYAFTPNWTAKVEYDYLGLSGWTAPSPVGVADTVNVKRQLNIVMVGINYKFGW